MQNISSFHQFIFEIQSILESRDQTDQTHFLIMFSQKILDQLLIHVILYQHAKNQGIL